MQLNYLNLVVFIHEEIHGWLLMAESSYVSNSAILSHFILLLSSAVGGGGCRRSAGLSGPSSKGFALRKTKSGRPGVRYNQLPLKNAAGFFIMRCL